MQIILKKIPNTDEYSFETHKFGLATNGAYGIVIEVKHQGLIKKLKSIANQNKFNFMWKNEYGLDLCILFHDFHLRIYNLNTEVVNAINTKKTVILEVYEYPDNHMFSVRVS